MKPTGPCYRCGLPAAYWCDWQGDDGQACCRALCVRCRIIDDREVVRFDRRHRGRVVTANRCPDHADKGAMKT